MNRPKISIELISRGEPTLPKVVESINGQDFEDYEVICADSSGREDVSRYLSDKRCRVVRLPPGTRAFVAREKAHENAKGELALLLDSTRVLALDRGGALQELWDGYHGHDMIIIREGTIGTSYWARQADTQRVMSERQLGRTQSEPLGFILPRCYRGELLTTAFKQIRQQWGLALDSVSYGEHQLIFEGCWKSSKDIVATKRRLLFHYEDETLTKILRKYYWYGKSQVELVQLRGSAANNLYTHRRVNAGITYRLQTLPIVTARVTPFMLGYVLERARRRVFSIGGTGSD
jgi:glycosyltransferase involved in cell wall biosynthesis